MATITTDATVCITAKGLLSATMGVNMEITGLDESDLNIVCACRCLCSHPAEAGLLPGLRLCKPLHAMPAVPCCAMPCTACCMWTVPCLLLLLLLLHCLILQRLPFTLQRGSHCRCCIEDEASCAGVSWPLFHMLYVFDMC